MTECLISGDEKMNELMKKIIAAEEERNSSGKFDPIVRLLKLVSSTGKLSQTVAGREDCRHDVGNCIVDILILSVANHSSIEQFLTASNLANIDETHDSVTSYMYELWQALGMLSTAITEGDDYRSILDDMLIILAGIARFSNYSVEECVEIAHHNFSH
jgi:hypothetical protein